jgi:outer membrane protein OmpA-like peptidoglycan-associated protein
MQMSVTSKPQINKKSAEEKVFGSASRMPAIKTDARAGIPVFLQRMALSAPDYTTLQRQPIEEEEELLQPKLTREIFQRQPIEEEEEELLQPKLTGATIQRQPLEEEEEEPIQTKLTVGGPNDEYEREADRVADQIQRADSARSRTALSPLSRSSTLGAAVEKGIRAKRGSGRPLPSETRLQMESNFGEDFSRVRIHNDPEANEMSQTLGANAFTNGRDIFFGRNKFAPGRQEGNRLLAHELAHVVQQGGQQGGQVQFDLMQSLPTALGGFEIEMETRAAPRPGLEGRIRFLPDPAGPYSARIGLIQIANVADVAGTTTTPGAPLDWSRVGTGGEAGRMDLMTTGTDGAPQGWFVDTRTDILARGTSSEPHYLEPYGESAGDNEYGWLRSPTDVKNASLWDYPSAGIDSDFEFETVAKAADTQNIYGSLEWGFGIRSGAVQNEHVESFDLESATFNEALERFRGYYAHEPLVIYFDTAQEMPIPGEEAKISDVLDYLSRYPDVMVRIEGYADERGSVALNNDLSQRRAENVERIAAGQGIDPSRIEYAVGWGETDAFAAGGNAGTWRANRRVVISFARTASTPIVMP